MVENLLISKLYSVRIFTSGYTPTLFRLRHTRTQGTVKLILDGTTGNRGGGLDGFSLGCLPPFPVSDFFLPQFNVLEDIGN